MFLLFLDRGIGREARQVVDGVEEVGKAQRRAI
jgi:hypothetical protein